MEQMSILTKEQRWFLDKINLNEHIRTGYYFTGGTALSEFYLRHRFSEDLDFFTTKKVDQQIIYTFIEEFVKQNKCTFDSEFFEVVYRFNLFFPNKSVLKVDFSFDPSSRVKKGLMYKNIQVDSLLDIAINKLVTVQQRVNVKDFVDLYFLLQEFSLWDLIEGAKIKHRYEVEQWNLASDFLLVDQFDVLPRMIISLKLEDLKKFFRKEAKKLGKRAID